MQIFLWTEDAEEKAGYIFWKTLMGTLFPEIIVESKQNCSELLKAITNISDDENKYIIAMDHSFDNDQVMREIIRLKKICAKRKNVYELNIISFEYILLEFKYLIEWIYAEGDDFREKRKHIINVRSKLISAISCKEDYKTIDEIQQYTKKIDSYNIEQFVYKVLFELTRNTGFEVNKKSIGVCWRTSCCEFENRQSDDLCGLDKRRIELRDKMQELYRYTMLENEFNKLGLGGIVC